MAGGLLLVALTAGAGLAGTGDDCPPNPEPGKCYEKVFRPARYEAYVEQTGDRTVTRQRKTREASFSWQVIPCDARPPLKRDR
jgi:hypothetical protein